MTVESIRRGSDYEAVRAAVRAEIAETKRLRRVIIGDVVLVFESRATVVAAIEEMVRAERLTEPDEIARAISDMAPALPGPGEVVVTMHLAVVDAAHLAELGGHLAGLDASVHLRVADEVIHPIATSGSSAPAHLIRFRLSESARAAWVAGPVTVTVSHPLCDAASDLSDDLRAALARDWDDTD